ncbi:hypothetical protein J5U22_01570 [Saccharolobus shibatae]|uniref:Uncharacterized protein n=1 Tax=Saccharolobus shibatae TaxID=2286 RepID=A0A8F5GZ69_9CREN|nr:hypothetical protein J5U21_01689 [Saccharolobus shibatae]QXJ35023.1 hypothetical protein J5U22_01570 [Saccharolobus shibatae]
MSYAKIVVKEYLIMVNFFKQIAVEELIVYFLVSAKRV